ncbi:hypothetical protein TNCV_1459051 [Trichonephila clavipes]|nr:hypothetical protein TNCV_1459051 [Trichonephila clavipes]
MIQRTCFHSSEVPFLSALHHHGNQANVLSCRWHLLKQQSQMLVGIPGVCGPSIWGDFSKFLWIDLNIGNPRSHSSEFHGILHATNTNAVSNMILKYRGCDVDQEHRYPHLYSEEAIVAKLTLATVARATVPNVVWPATCGI